MWIAFAAGVLVGSFLAMFTLALFISGADREIPARREVPDGVSAPDVIPITAYRRTTA